MCQNQAVEPGSTVSFALKDGIGGDTGHTGNRVFVFACYQGSKNLLEIQLGTNVN